MHRLYLLCSVAWLLAPAIASPARAALFDFEGTLLVDLGLGTPSATTGTGVATVNASGGLGHLSSLSLPGGVFAGSTVTTPTTPPTVASILITLSNRSGVFTGGSTAGTLGGVMPLPGMARVCLFFTNCEPSLQLIVPFTQNQTRGVGIGGEQPITNDGFTLFGAPWTLGTASVSTANGAVLTQQGFAHGPASMTGLSSAANLSGVVQLVTPVSVITPFDTLVTGFGIARVHFVPQPAPLILLGSGVAGLLVLASRRR